MKEERTDSGPRDRRKIKLWKKRWHSMKMLNQLSSKPHREGYLEQVRHLLHEAGSEQAVLWGNQVKDGGLFLMTSAPAATLIPSSLICRNRALSLGLNSPDQVICTWSIITKKKAQVFHPMLTFKTFHEMAKIS